MKTRYFVYHLGFGDGNPDEIAKNLNFLCHCCTKQVLVSTHTVVTQHHTHVYGVFREGK